MKVYVLQNEFEILGIFSEKEMAQGVGIGETSEWEIDDYMPLEKGVVYVTRIRADGITHMTKIKIIKIIKIRHPTRVVVEWTMGELIVESPISAENAYELAVKEWNNNDSKREWAIEVRAILNRNNSSKNKKLHKKSSRNTSGVVGVRFAKDREKWHAEITVDGKCTNLGYYDEKEMAVKARKDAEIQYFGEVS